MARGSATERLAQRVSRIRQQRGLSQEALAAKAGVNRLTVTRLEAAAHPPTIETLDRIARALGVSLADLVG
jgi:XRE family transcriptional regulator, regulator of sulfur utilization